jgi:pilus assembly protein Flp/PilA
MKSIVAAVKGFINDEAGVTAIEYGLIAALIALAIIAGVTAVGSNLSDVFSDIAASV